ncbi:MAG: SH3 domain-containing protein [Eubacteriales bacterium]|nr:SH3 domain-containing protein [Eubacteriales bacterium]
MSGAVRKFILCLTAAVMLFSIPAFAETGVVTPSKGVNMRSGPGVGYSIVETLPYGTEVSVTGSCNGWYAVSYGSSSGYVSSSYLSIRSDQSSSAPSIFLGTQTETSSGGSVSGTAPSIFSGTGTSLQVQTQTVISSESQSAPSIFSSSVTQSASGGSWAGVVTGDYVRFRTGPSISYTIKATLRKGTSVSVSESYGDWYKCTVNGESGFISSQYVTAAQQTSASASSVSGGSSAVSIFQSASTSQQQIAVTKVPQILGYIAGSNVRFRSGPGIDYEILGTFQYGNSFYITGYSGDWTAGTANGKSGFVSSQYVREGTYSAPSQTVSSISSGTAAGTDSTDGQTGQPAESASSQQLTAVPYVPVTGQQIADLAASLAGSKYKWAGASPEEGFDCSGFVQYVYKYYGITVNRTSAGQAENGVHIAVADARPGDILCFYSGSEVSHSGIYIGENKFVHAASSATGVVVTELTGYYADRGYEVRRIIT